MLKTSAPLARATLSVQTGKYLLPTMRHLPVLSQQYHPHLLPCHAMCHLAAVPQQYHPYHTTCRCLHVPLAKTLKPCVGIQVNLFTPCVGIQVSLITPCVGIQVNLFTPCVGIQVNLLASPLPHQLDHLLNRPLDHPLPHQLEHPIAHRQDLPLERPLVTPRMPLLTPLQLCMAFPSSLNAATAVRLA